MFKRLSIAVLAVSLTTALTSITVLGQEANPRSVGLVGIRNPQQARAIAAKFGTKALWAWDGGAARFRSLANYQPPTGATLFATTASVESVFGTETLSAQFRRLHWPRPSGSNATPPPSSSTVPTNQGFPPATTPPVSTSTTVAPSNAPANGPVPANTTGVGSTLLSDLFNLGSLSSSTWNSFIASNASAGWAWNSNGSGGSSSANPTVNNDLEYDLPSNVSVGSGGLTMTAWHSPVDGILGSSPFTYPWSSGAVSSYGHFEFTGGTVQIEAKMPSGNGLWPGLWMLPGSGASHGDDAEIDLFEGGFTGNGVSPNQNFAWHLLHGSSGVGGTVDVGTDLTAGYHFYGLKWVPGTSLTWYFDGRQIAQVTSATASIPTEPMELIMTLQVAADSTSSWHTTVDASTPSTAQMQIRQIEVTG